jgi:hypothetical protein
MTADTMTAEKIELVIEAIESGNLYLALNMARSTLETMNQDGEVKEFISDYPLLESRLNWNGP